MWYVVVLAAVPLHHGCGVSRYIKLKEVPSVDELMPALTYLYTGLLPSTTFIGPDTLFGLLQNAQYLMCDRLIQECSTILINKIKTPDPYLFLNHEAFDVAWVPATVIRELSKQQTAYWSVFTALQRLRRQTSIDDSILDILRSSQGIASQLTVSELHQLSRRQTPCLATSVILLNVLADRLVTIDQERAQNAAAAQMTQDVYCRRCNRHY